MYTSLLCRLIKLSQLPMGLCCITIVMHVHVPLLVITGYFYSWVFVFTCLYNSSVMLKLRKSLVDGILSLSVICIVSQDVCCLQKNCSNWILNKWVLMCALWVHVMLFFCSHIPTDLLKQIGHVRWGVNLLSVQSHSKTTWYSILAVMEMWHKISFKLSRKWALLWGSMSMSLISKCVCVRARECARVCRACNILWMCGCCYVLHVYYMLANIVVLCHF